MIRPPTDSSVGSDETATVGRSSSQSGRRTRSEGDNRGHEGLVNVVLPTYERADAVGSAVKSVLVQSYKRFELVVVDGGSTDGTREVIESVNDPRVRYRRRDEPAGPSAARNLGLHETDGEFVAFVDSDDRWHPDKLRRQVSALRSGGPRCAVAYTDIEKAEREGEPRTREGESGKIEAAVRRMAVPTYTSTLLVRRRALAAVGGFDERLPCFEDWDLCLRLAADHEFAYLSDLLVVKGSAGDNLSTDPDRLVTAVHRLRTKYALPDRTLARLLADAGVTACEAGQFDRGQTYLRAALQRDPRRPKAVAALLLSLPGSAVVFDAGMDCIYALEWGCD